MHILITGKMGVGKTTLVQRLIKEMRQPITGFVTKKVTHFGSQLSSVHIHSVTDELRLLSDANCVGRCDEAGAYAVYPNVFDTLGVKYLEDVSDSVVIMDELGFMEREAEVFKQRVLSLLDGEIPVIAVVKDREAPFLEKIKAHENVVLYHVTLENREAVYRQLSLEVKQL